MQRAIHTLSIAHLLLLLPIFVEGCYDRTSSPTGTNTEPAAPKVLAGRVNFDPHHLPDFIAPDGHHWAIASMLVPARRMSFGDFIWRDLSSSDGHVWVRVDLARQLVSVFRGGDEIGTAVIIYGTDGKATPSGTFPVRGKERMHRSAAYDADMPFTLWLTADGVAIHASAVESGRATHGCIGVPPDFASKLFAVINRGNTVVILPARTQLPPT